MSTIDTKTAAAKIQAMKARDDLADTLDAIEQKFDVPKRFIGAAKKNPLPYVIGGAAAAAVLLGVVAWKIFGDD